MNNTTQVNGKYDVSNKGATNMTQIKTLNQLVELCGENDLSATDEVKVLADTFFNGDTTVDFENNSIWCNGVWVSDENVQRFIDAVQQGTVRLY